MGDLPDSRVFSGQSVSSGLKGGQLVLCKHCGSMFRHPVLPASEYRALYEQIPGSLWDSQFFQRNDVTLLRSHLEARPGGTVLDIGCYTGSFLAALAPKFEKFGVEPSDAAAHQAGAAGVHILGGSLDEVAEEWKFDVVVAIDVIEHVLDVEGFMNNAWNHVKEGGLLAISTGNPGCLIWKRVMKARFWYCQFAEHVTFPGRKFYEDFALRRGAMLPQVMYFRYFRLGLRDRASILTRFARIALRNLMNQVKLGTMRIFTGRYVEAACITQVNVAGVFKDHHLILISKQMTGHKSR